jgi:hypothetical protein
VALDPQPLTPEWWLARLYKQLMERQEALKFFDDYYCGAHPLPWLAPQAREEFRRILKMTRSNYMGLVCDSTAERMQVIDFRVGEQSEGDKDSRRIWQKNNMDFYSDQAILESIITGTSYLSLGPNAKDPANPFIWAEHPSQVVVEYAPGSNRRDKAAGVKVWIDDWTGKINATLHLAPGSGRPRALIFKYQAAKPANTATPPQWERREVKGEKWPAVNPLGKVPFYELPNNPRLLTGGRSEIEDVTDIQDRINKTLADRLITQDYGAFPQKWATAWPDEDDEGNPQPKIDVGRDRMVTSSVQETQFGQWAAAPLDPYSAAKREDVKDIASRTRTPAQYLLGELTNVNGETLKAAESGLISKVRQRIRGVDDGFEDCMIDARQLAGLPVLGNEDIEVMWRNPEYRTEGELTSALVQMGSLHVPHQILWEKWGATPPEVERWEALAIRNSRDDAWQEVAGEPTATNERITLTNPADAPPTPPNSGPPPPPAPAPARPGT